MSSIVKAKKKQHQTHITISKHLGENKMSKGSKPRPFSVSQAEWESRWDAIFSRDLPPEPPAPKAITEEYRVNKQGQTERFHEGQWELDPNQK